MSTLALPAKGNVTNEYDAGHRALDFGWGNGKQVYAAAAGTVTYQPSLPGYGNRISINHGKIISQGAITKYAHLSRAIVSSGEEVRKGQLIGYMGETGSYAVSGVHLHFELWVNFGSGWARVNPGPFFTDTAGGGAPLPIPSERPKSMSTIYYYTSNDKPAGEGGTIKLYALAGESPGTSANWLETASSDIKAAWSTAHGAGVFLTKASFDSFKARHLEPLKTLAPALTLDIPALAAALEAARPPMKLGVTLLGTATEEE